MIRSLGRFGLFCADLARSSAFRRPPRGAVAEHAWGFGVRALPILGVIAAFVGTNLALQGYDAFRPLGGEKLVGMFVGLAGVREMAPIIAGSMVAARAGTEMASQLAVMRIREQVDALEVMAVQPHWYLVYPRVLAILLVMPALSVFSTAFMLGAGWLVAVFQLGLNGAEFMDFVSQATEPADLGWGMVKGLYFGLVIGLVSCYNGFFSEPGPSGVGAATNRAVVVSAVTCVGMNYFISEMIY